MTDVRHDDFQSKRRPLFMTYRRIADGRGAKFSSFVDSCYQVAGLRNGRKLLRVESIERVWKLTNCIGMLLANRKKHVLIRYVLVSFPSVGDGKISSGRA